MRLLALHALTGVALAALVAGEAPAPPPPEDPPAVLEKTENETERSLVGGGISGAEPPPGLQGGESPDVQQGQPPQQQQQQQPQQDPQQPQQEQHQQQQPQQNPQQPQQEQQQQQQQGQQQEQPEEQAAPTLLLAALPLETLFQHMSDMQKKFFLAILPETWTVPKFIPQRHSDLAQVQHFLKDLSNLSGAPSLPEALMELAEAAHNHTLSQVYPQLPPIFQHLLSVCTGTFDEAEQSLKGALSSFLPDLEAADLEVVARLFRIPSGLEFPVSPEGLSLFLPVIVRNIAAINLPLEELQAGGLKEIKANVRDIFVPVSNLQGQLMFADAVAAFQGLQLPQELPLKPLALFSALEMNNVGTLWSAVKVPLLSKLSLLGSGASVVFGPVMALTSLPRIALSLNGDSHARGSSQLSRIVGDVSSHLRRSLRTFEDLLSPEAVPISTQTLMQEPLEEFLNLKFLNLALPFIGVARELEPGVYTPLKSMTLCSESDCLLGLSPSSFPEFLVSPIVAIAKLHERALGLSADLQAAVAELQQKIDSLLPEGVSAAADAQGVSIDEALNTALRLSKTLQGAVSAAGDRLNLLFQGGTAAEAAAEAAPEAATAKTALRNLEKPQNVASYEGPQEKYKPTEEAGLLAPRRRLQGGLIELPLLSHGLDLSHLELPGQGTLEQLLSLRQLTSAVANFVLDENSPLLAGLSPSVVGRSLGALFRENLLPAALLQQPLSLLVSESTELPASLKNLTLGQVLSLSSALEALFASPLMDLPNLDGLAINPAALLSLSPGAPNPLERLLGARKENHPAAPVDNVFF